ncbi:hypothetical protein CAEBREN_15333 [Caenorhabditis brenneri]|uniref:F-box domain-containing protein n=1 Tax=Caenorhabditis brenneri TaxID=135651 RepID=G0MC55_CAEBE|nr:hypothetical protein CAEBREN_15333 [Caenorhabditis brenneri]
MSFPFLLQLPYNSIKNVIKTMDIRDTFGFSLISKKSALLVKAIKLKVKYFTVTVASTLRVEITICEEITLTFHFYETEQIDYDEVPTEPPKDLYPPGYVVLSNWRNYEKREFTMKKWIDHFLKHLFPKVQFLDIHCTRSHYELMRDYFNYSDSINIRRDNMVLEIDLGVIPKILIRNFDLVETWFYLEMSLNELLIGNAQSFIYHEVSLSNKQINMFLKCWMKGACPNLKHTMIRVFSEKPLDLDVVWKGIKNQAAPQDGIGICETCDYFLQFKGGVNIKRFDGVVATVFIEPVDNGSFSVCDLNMFVDHR